MPDADNTQQPSLIIIPMPPAGQELRLTRTSDGFCCSYLPIAPAAPMTTNPALPTLPSSSKENEMLPGLTRATTWHGKRSHANEAATSHDCKRLKTRHSAEARGETLVDNNELVPDSEEDPVPVDGSQTQSESEEGKQAWAKFMANSRTSRQVGTSLRTVSSPPPQNNHSLWLQMSYAMLGSRAQILARGSLAFYNVNVLSAAVQVLTPAAPLESGGIVSASRSRLYAAVDQFDALAAPLLHLALALPVSMAQLAASTPGRAGETVPCVLSLPLAIVSSACSGSTKALATTNLLLRAASEALQWPPSVPAASRPPTPGTSTQSTTCRLPRLQGGIPEWP
ncbi:hypothetical protein DENSPDRAFT_876948 [Dentipellis sp. KUC8613]|nr:hypothetical protein DENSPDRAFT_876948 [Dentipellis sp. KUC8613]